MLATGRPAVVHSLVPPKADRPAPCTSANARQAPTPPFLVSWPKAFARSVTVRVIVSLYKGLGRRLSAARLSGMPAATLPLDDFYRDIAKSQKELAVKRHRDRPVRDEGSSCHSSRQFLSVFKC